MKKEIIITKTACSKYWLRLKSGLSTFAAAIPRLIVVWFAPFAYWNESCLAFETTCVDPSPGLGSWWSADGNPPYSYGGNPAMLSNGVTFAQGIVGQSFSLDGKSNYVRLPDDVFPYPTSGMGSIPFSFEVWFKTTSGGVILGQQNSIPFKTPTSYVPGIYVGTDGRLYVQVFWANGGSASIIASPKTVNDGIFHHVAATFDGVTRIVYLDGFEIGRKASPQKSYASSYKYQLGTGFTGSTWPARPSGWYSFKGLLDEASYYNRALSSDEVYGIYTAGQAGKFKPAAPSDAILSTDSKIEGRDCGLFLGG